MYFVQCIKKYFDFNGRATRTEFWCFILSISVIGGVLSVLDSLLGTESATGKGILLGVFNLFALVPTLAVGSRRLHDIGKSGWWQLLYLTIVGVFVLIVLWMLESNKEPNKYGEHVIDNIYVPHLVAQVISLAIVVSFFAMHANDIDLVKNTVMDIDKSLTVGEAFDNWQDCSSRKWEALETENGRRVVQFTCDVKNVRAYLDAVAQSADVQNDALDIDSQKQIIQWRINKDETVRLSYVGFEIAWLDGKFSEGKSDNAESIVRSAYSNDITYDLKEWGSMEPSLRKATASMFYRMFAVLYAQAK